MNTKTVTLQLPANLYEQLRELAAAEQIEPEELLSHLVSAAYQQRGWLRDLVALREQIRRDGGLQVGLTKADVIERLRQTRREIFEAEYAHLYRLNIPRFRCPSSRMERAVTTKLVRVQRCPATVTGSLKPEARSLA